MMKSYKSPQVEEMAAEQQILGCFMAFDIEKYYDTASFEDNNDPWLVFCLTLGNPTKGVFVTTEMSKLQMDGYRMIALARGDDETAYFLDLVEDLTPVEAEMLSAQASQAMKKAMRNCLEVGMTNT